MLDLVGAQDDRGIPILLRISADAELGGGAIGDADGDDQPEHRHRDQEPPRHAGDVVLPAVAPRPRRHHPSSRCSKVEAPKIRLMPVGVQAASATGTFAEMPRAKTTLETT